MLLHYFFDGKFFEKNVGKGADSCAVWEASLHSGFVNSRVHVDQCQLVLIRSV